VTQSSVDTLFNEPALPNLGRLVAGKRVRGSWWAHPRAQEIFQVYDALEDHPDVLIMKLISRKVIYIHRRSGHRSSPSAAPASRGR
jgi:hypothetical protein